MQGKTHWVWCFASDDSVNYMIDRSRGSPALMKFFIREFDGTLVTDSWSPYDQVLCADQQKCWPHLLSDVASVDDKHRGDADWDSFRRRLMRASSDAKKVHAQKGSIAEDQNDTAVARLEGRLATMGAESWEHVEAKRLAKRLAKYGNQLLTFLWYENVPLSNNTGERAIRPAVMIRKNSYANGSDRSALIQSVLMSVFRTFRLRGLDPITEILQALAAYPQTGTLPPIPTKPTPEG